MKTTTTLMQFTKILHKGLNCKDAHVPKSLKETNFYWIAYDNVCKWHKIKPDL